MLKIMVVEKVETRRADFVDAICEISGVQACAAAGGFVDALRILSAQPMDAVVVGALPDAELKQLTTLARTFGACDVLVVDDASELVTRVESLRVRRSRPEPSFGGRAEALALTRANRIELAHRLRVAHEDRSAGTPRGLQTLVLKDWLPSICGRFAGLMPAYVELVALIAEDTPAVRCVPEVVEHELFDIVLDAAAKLPWGGTIWLTAERTADDGVRIDVLENGLGTGGDVVLRTAAAAS